MTDLTPELQDKLDAAAFRRLLSHLDANKEVQNIDLMILADFCRNCLGDWYLEAAQDNGVEMDKAAARKRIYGMSYDDWKAQHQKPASPEQMAAFEARQKRK